MNNDLQHKYIADACGFDTFPMHGEFKSGWVIPDYLNDLNSIALAVSYQVELEGFAFQERYVRELRAVVTRPRRGCNEMQTDYWMAEATPKQRAEALLKAINLWVDTP